MSERGRALRIGRRHGPLVVTAAVAGLLIATGALLPEGFAWLERRQAEPVEAPTPPEVLVYGAVGIMVCLFFLSLVIGFAGVRDQPPRASHRMGRQLIVLLGVVAALVTLPPLRRGLDRALEALPTVAREATRPGERAGPPAPSQEPLGVVVAVLIGVGLAGVTVALLRARGEGRRPDAQAEEGLRDEIEASIEDLTTIEDPRAAVIACYRRLQDAATEAGISRRPSDTPFELLSRLLQRRSVPEESARRLTILFERAKFSTTAIDETMRAEALASLTEVRAQLGATA
jgi:hypothetical protein